MEQRHILSNRQPRPFGLTGTVIAERLARGPGQRRRSDAANALRLGGDALPPPAADRPPDKALVPAAVLVPLIERSQGWTVLLTQRTAHLSNHAGQISFPGGRVEEQDSDALATALRETEEEIGLPRRHVELLGWLDDYVTGTGFKVTPVVGRIAPPFPLVPDPFEVAEVFEVPLDFLLDPGNHQRCSRLIDGRDRPFYAMPYQDRYIWGATAGMLVNLYEALTA